MGRMVRSITLREPEFNDEDVVELLALRELHRETGRYGESLAEAYSDAASPTYYGPGAIRFVAKWRVNYAEAAVEAAQAAAKDDIPAGAAWYVDRESY